MAHYLQSLTGLTISIQLIVLVLFIMLIWNLISKPNELIGWCMNYLTQYSKKISIIVCALGVLLCVWEHAHNGVHIDWDVLATLFAGMGVAIHYGVKEKIQTKDKQDSTETK